MSCRWECVSFVIVVLGGEQHTSGNKPEEVTGRGTQPLTDWNQDICWIQQSGYHVAVTAEQVTSKLLYKTVPQFSTFKQKHERAKEG